MKDKISEIELIINIFITHEQAGKLKIIKQHYDNIEACKAELENVILSLYVPYSEEISLILTVPLFKNIFSAIAIVSEIVGNMDVFPIVKHLYSLVQLTPTNNESSGNKKSVRISIIDSTLNLL